MFLFQDLARAATLVDAQLKAQGQAQGQKARDLQLPASPNMEAVKAGDMPIAEPDKVGMETTLPQA